MTLKHFIKELDGNRVEGELIKTTFYSLVLSMILFGFFYLILFKKIDDFIPRYGFYLFFALASYALFIPTIRQVRAYNEMACMPGMMIGMTMGMLGGFLSGFYLAATNGMFIGSVFGMIIGIALGTWLGSCCGIMGFLEGIMAGFMGGMMGAMTAFMLLNDHIRLATILMFIISMIINISLNYMIYNEMRQNKRTRKEDHFWTMIITFVLTIATMWLMVFGPRSGIFN